MPDSQPSAGKPGLVRTLLAPSLVDVFFAAVSAAAFARPGGWQGLLADGDTGWHVRTGELILKSGSVPLVDPFSFTRPGQEWFAWEWLADVLFAAAYQVRGIGMVAAVSGVVLCLAATILFAWLLRRGAGLWIALGVTLGVASASTVHYLARPHVFSILFYTVALWILDEDRRRGGARVWLLVPLAAVWANLHGGFPALIATTAVLSAVCLLVRDVRHARRYGLVTILCSAATCLNPYGWRLHAHIASYLNSRWILEHVQEFQSPSIRSEGTVVFAVLLLAGAVLASRAFARREWFEGVLVLVWGFAALRSARHIPLYTIAAAPVIATECALLWRRVAEHAPARAVNRVFWELAQDLGQSRRASLWLLLTAWACLAAAPFQAGFPESRFPVRAAEVNAKRLAPPGAMPRVLTPDQWADYLIFRFHPRQRVFFDGRSDFYGPALGTDYRRLQVAAANWREVLERYGFELALLPPDWPLSTMLEREPGWNRVYQDSVAVLYQRAGRDGRK